MSEHPDKIDTPGFGLSKARHFVLQIRELCAIFFPDLYLLPITGLIALHGLRLKFRVIWLYQRSLGGWVGFVLYRNGAITMSPMRLLYVQCAYVYPYVSLPLFCPSASIAIRFPSY